MEYHESLELRQYLVTWHNEFGLQAEYLNSLADVRKYLESMERCGIDMRGVDVSSPHGVAWSGAQLISKWQNV